MALSAIQNPINCHVDAVMATTNHFYRPDDCIGQGATCFVYRGFNKATGEERALKISKQAGCHRDTRREIEALVLLDHKNIVKFHGIEDDLQTSKNVIVYEHCNGGSLYSLLQQPEYSRGLPDAEFISLMRDICAGLNCIFSQGLIHRDIKPGNILCDIDVHGGISYKISDFGSSRQYDNENESGFMSLAGTEEYLHPTIYENAFIHVNNRVQSTSGVDRWSLGATFYHAATGEIPFKPFGGARKNRDVMFEMISKKPTGKISGIQEKRGGRIRWRSELPSESSMSDERFDFYDDGGTSGLQEGQKLTHKGFNSGLKQRIEVILARLLEKDSRLQWNYITLFEEVKRVEQAVVVTVLDVSKCEYHKLYMDRLSNVSYITDLVASLTEIPATAHKYFIDDKLLEEVVQMDSHMKCFPPTSEEYPVLFFPLEESCLQCQSIDYPRAFPGKINPSEDAKVALDVACSIHFLLLCTRKSVIAAKVIQSFIKSLSISLHNAAVNCIKEYELLKTIVEERELRRDLVLKICYGPREVSNGSLQNQREAVRNTSVLVYQELEKMRYCISNLTHKIENLRNLNFSTNNERRCSDLCISGAENMFQKAKSVSLSMDRWKRLKTLTQVQHLQQANNRNMLLKLTSAAFEQWNRCCNRQRSICGVNAAESLRKCSNIKSLVIEAQGHLEELSRVNRKYQTELSTLSVYTESISSDLSLDCIISPCENVGPDLSAMKRNLELVRNRSKEFEDIVMEEMDV